MIIVLESVKTRISAPADPSVTGFGSVFLTKELHSLSPANFVDYFTTSQFRLDLYEDTSDVFVLSG